MNPGISAVTPAQQLAQEYLSSSLPRRWNHVQGVAAAAASVSAHLPSTVRDTVVAAAWLHDIGYAPRARRSGFHPLDGAATAASAGFPDLVVALIAHHTGAAMEAQVRGISDLLAPYPPPPPGLLDLLTYADLTTSPDGIPTDGPSRIREILTRYRPDDPVHRAVTLSTPALLATVNRIQGTPHPGRRSGPEPAA